MTFVRVTVRVSVPLSASALCAWAWFPDPVLWIDDCAMCANVRAHVTPKTEHQRSEPNGWKGTRRSAQPGRVDFSLTVHVTVEHPILQAPSRPGSRTCAMWSFAWFTFWFLLTLGPYMYVIDSTILSAICVKPYRKPTELKIKHKLAPATVRASQGGSGVFVAFV